MSNVFPKWMNYLPTALAAGAGVALVGVVWGTWYYATPDYMEVGYEPHQPVDYSHQIHAGKLGIDCRYCHSHVEESRHANIPATQTCLNCHTGEGEEAYLNLDLWRAHRENPNLIKVRNAGKTGEPIQWRRVHKLPDYAHFNHSVHINAGVSCYSCHRRIDQMQIVRQQQGLGMGWCLDCHRNPEKNLVRADDIVGLDGGGIDPTPRITDLGAIAALLMNEREQSARGAEIAREKRIEPPQHCGACHY